MLLILCFKKNFFFLPFFFLATPSNSSSAVSGVKRVRAEDVESAEAKRARPAEEKKAEQSHLNLESEEEESGRVGWKVCSECGLRVNDRIGDLVSCSMCGAAYRRCRRRLFPFRVDECDSDDMPSLDHPDVDDDVLPDASLGDITALFQEKYKEDPAYFKLFLRSMFDMYKSNVVVPK